MTWQDPKALAEYAADLGRLKNVSLELAIAPEGLVIRAVFSRPGGPPRRDGLILDYADLESDPDLAQRKLDELAGRA